MPNRSMEPADRGAHALRHALHEADDQKIRRITAMLDDVVDPAGKQAILDPLRGRLGVLRPMRPLRFVRLLFTPFDALIVPPNVWRPDDATLPRNVLASLSLVVRTGFGADVSVIDRIIAGHKADAAAVVAVAGEALWPRAAEILAAAPVPADWEHTGMRPTLYRPLADAVATVLRRASQLLALARDTEVGVLAVDRATVEAILRSLGEESADGAAMVVALILRQSPHAIPVLRQYVSSLQNAAEKAALQRALGRGIDQVLTRLESPPGGMDEIARAPLAAVGDDVRRLVSLLGEMADDAGFVAHRPRLKAMRERLDRVCRDRFADGLTEGLVLPLASASDALDGAGQTMLEGRARDLRSLETVARTVGGAGGYDKLLHQAAEAARMAAKAGTLTPIRMLRLVEILAGPESAAAMYRQAHAEP